MLCPTLVAQNYGSPPSDFFCLGLTDAGERENTKQLRDLRSSASVKGSRLKAHLFTAVSVELVKEGGHARLSRVEWLLDSYRPSPWMGNDCPGGCGVYGVFGGVANGNRNVLGECKCDPLDSDSPLK